MMLTSIDLFGQRLAEMRELPGIHARVAGDSDYSWVGQSASSSGVAA